jgi:hypothetical protein
MDTRRLPWLNGPVPVVPKGVFLAGLLPWLTACAVAWPWSHSDANHPLAVHEVVFESAQGIDPAQGITPAVGIDPPQYWDRNTLLIDLSAVPASGALALRPAQGNGWPVRLAFRVRPGSMESLEVRGEQRVVYAVPNGSKPVLLALDPGVYSPRTASISLQWSAADGLAR